MDSDHPKENKSILEKRLQETTLQNDKEISNLERKFLDKFKIIETQLLEKSKEVDSLRAAFKLQEKRIKYLEGENNKLKVLNPNMGQLEWEIQNYSHLRSIGDTYYSPKFYSSFNGHCCQIYITWHGMRNGRVEFGFRICRSNNCQIHHLIKI